MVRPYSLDLRERVVAAAQAGQSCRAVAKTFGVSVSSVVKWRQRARTTGSAAARPMGSKRPVLLAGQRAFILDRIALEPHISIRALQAELAERGTIASYGAVWTFLHRQDLSHKKKPASKRAGAARRRPSSRPLEKISAAD
jgi:transposase